ncbi:unnamed protein product [Alopecurus aequalis]
MSTKLVAASSLVLLLAALNAAGVESQRGRRVLPIQRCHFDFSQWRLVCPGDDVPVNPTPVNSPPPPAPTLPSMFVFGDSYVDNGNLDKTQHPFQIIRQWYDPYGCSYAKEDGSPADKCYATGRFSNYLVQSDFIGKLLGLNEAPPPYLSSNGYCDNAGMTFAVGGSGVYPVQLGVPTLSDQLDNFLRLVESGCITPAQIDVSVVLIAVSGNDYDRVGVAQPSALGAVNALAKNVTSEIAAAVDRLEKVGVNRILVNNLHPVGCTPAHTQTGPGKYEECDRAGNGAAEAHNQNLQQLLANRGNVLVLDLYSAFIGIVDASDKGSDLSRRFKNKKTPCCAPNDPNGFCGAMGGTMDDPVMLHTVCTNPEKHFYWDEMHPTHAGWTAVMEQLDDPIRTFLWPPSNN